MLKNEFLFFRNNVSEFNQNSCITITELLLAVSRKEERDLFLKIDIKGDKILVLLNIIDNLDSSSGIILKFYRTSAIWNVIISFVESLIEVSMYLDHILINHYGNINPNLLSNVIKLSFSRASPRENSIKKLPTQSLEAPDSPLRPDNDVCFKLFSLLQSDITEWRIPKLT